jgi:hypothetical protein
MEVVARDCQKPTAVLDAPRQVEVGQSFQLSGSRSTDTRQGGSFANNGYAVLKNTSETYTHYHGTATAFAAPPTPKSASALDSQFLISK